MSTSARFTTRAVLPSDADAFVLYAYEPPHDLYNSAPDSAGYYCDSKNGYFSIIDMHDELWGFGCTGVEAQVPGGRYGGEEGLVDLGVGMAPCRVGRGDGAVFCGAAVAFARRNEATPIRVTVAEFNSRSIRVWESLGFSEVHRFLSLANSSPFIQLVSHG